MERIYQADNDVCSGERIGIYVGTQVCIYNRFAVEELSKGNKRQAL